MISLPFSHDVVQKVFDCVEQYKQSGVYPDLIEPDFFSMLPCILELQIDSFILHLCPLIGQNITKISDRYIKMIPKKFEQKVIDNIPISVLDPDFFVDHFDVEYLCKKLDITYAWQNPLNPFNSLFLYKEEDPIKKAANVLVNLSYDRFGQSRFVKENASVVWTKTPLYLHDYKNVKFLKIYNCEDLSNLSLALVPTLIRLEISESHLRSEHMKVLLSFLKDSNVTYLSLRDNKFGFNGCQAITTYLTQNPFTKLQYLDIGLNAIGADGISKLLTAFASTDINALSIDGNFFRPSHDDLGNLGSMSKPIMSVRSLHWDSGTVSILNDFLKQDCVKWVDMSAQVIHQNSDPDLSGSMAEILFKDASETIETLIFANHRLDHMDFSCISRLVNLKYLNLANSTLDSTEIEVLCPLLNTLEKLDLSYNNMTFRTNAFLTACAQSKSLRLLNLTNNYIVSKGFSFFDELMANKSPIKTLRISNCGLKQKQNASFMRLMASGVMDFDELDVSSNDLMHVKSYITTTTPTHIVRLNVSGNQQKFEAFEEFLKLVKGVKYIDIDYVPFSMASKIAYLLEGVNTIHLSFVNSGKIEDIIKLINDSRCHILWAYNSISNRVFQQLMLRWAEIPSLLYMHVEDGKQAVQSSKIPLIFEERKR